MLKRSTQHLKHGEKIRGGELLILSTKGTYGCFDDAYSGIQLGLAMAVEGRNANIVLLEDGVFAGIQGQNPMEVGKGSLSRDLADFMDLGGELYALRNSLTTRGLTHMDMLEGIRIVNHASLAKLTQTHKYVLTF